MVVMLQLEYVPKVLLQLTCLFRDMCILDKLQICYVSSVKIDR